MSQRFLPRKAAAEYAGVCTRTIDRLLKDGTLTRYCLRGKTLIDKRQLDRMIRQSARMKAISS